MSAPQESRPPRSGVAALLVLALALGAWLRVDGLRTAPLYGDEHHTAEVAALPAHEIVRTFDAVGSHVGLPLVSRLCALGGVPSLTSLRLASFAAGVLALVVLFALGRRLVGDAAAVLATLALAVSPIHVYYSGFARPYAVVVLLSLLLVAAVRRGPAAKPFSRRRQVAIALLVAALPWFHLSSLGFVAVVLVWALGSTRFDRRLVGAAAAGVTLAALAFLPVGHEVLEFFAKQEPGERMSPTGAAGIATLLGGGWVAGWVLATSAVAALVVACLRRDAGLAWCVVPALGSVLVLAVLRPHGMEYAYSRYLLTALPLLLLAAGRLLVAVTRRLGGQPVALAIGAVASAVLFVTGPHRSGVAAGRPFSNTYLALFALPAFDEPYPGTPRIYARIARDEAADVVVEFPHQQSRSVLLLRNYARQHGKRTLIGLDASRRGRIRGAPYVDLFDPHLAEKTGADYLIAHTAIHRELVGYWRFVFDQAWPRERRRGDEGLMRRNERWHPTLGYASWVVPELIAVFGPPTHVDEQVAVWRF